ncbi:MAG TPA: porin family protein [Salinimicrobium sp.]|nr:porin family protein [Salinimicrobium sp.]
MKRINEETLSLWYMRFFYKIFIAFSFLSPFGMSAQQAFVEGIDSLYREDQFYIGFTYNILAGMPEELNSSGFSWGLHTGFIRDFPINQQRNIAVGAGIGWSIDTYGHNLFIGENSSENTIFRSLDDAVIDYSSNRFTTQTLEIPLQFRWRSSTAQTYKFWRVYTGLKVGYVYYFRSNFEQPNNRVRQTDVPEFNRFRTGATFTFGYNTFNFYFYYSLNPFFNEEAKINSKEIGMTTFQVGLMFYIL